MNQSFEPGACLSSFFSTRNHGGLRWSHRNGASALAVLLLVTAAAAQSTWTQAGQSNPPTARQSPRLMAYDSANDRIVLFGGSNGTTYLGDTHVFDCSTNVWSQVSGGPSPSARYGHSLTYDSIRNEVVVFGGRTGNAAGPLSHETWVFTGSSWQLRSPSHWPTDRWLSATTFDSVRGVTVLFGGSDNTNSLSDTWEWSGVDWVLRASTVPSPNPLRSNSSVAYDPHRQRTVIFGGRTTSTFFGGTLEWDGISWTNVTPATTSPPNRAAGAMAYDESLDRIVLFGANTQNGALHDTWFWDGSVWTPVTPPVFPSDRANSGMVYDSLRERLVLFGGNSPSIYFSDLWTFASATPARLVPFGQGCAQPTGYSLMPANHRRPWLDDHYDLVVNGAPLGLFVLASGVSNHTWNGLPLPLSLGNIGLTGCSLLVSLDLVSGETNPAPFTLPNNPTLAGLSLFHQALVFSPGLNPFGALLTDGLEATLGLR